MNAHLVFRTFSLWALIFGSSGFHLTWGQQSNEEAVQEFIFQYRKLQQERTDAQRIAASNALQLAMVDQWTAVPFHAESCAALEEAMGFAVAQSGDHQLAVISWNVELTNQSQAYGGVMIFNTKKSATVIEPLEFKRSTSIRQTMNEKARFTAKDWPGAVYYKALIHFQGNRPIYTLLGWDGADNIRTRKVIETATISGSKVKFGVPVIQVDNATHKRFIMEYSDQVSAMLQWRDDMDMIVMDHLSAPRPELEGQTAYYGPDMSYDGLSWKKNQWVLEHDIDVRDPELQGPWNNPKKLRKRRGN